jgi:antitoxin (DNA-binding transcriptional repressor) of toxin-antitoxin stability system
LGAKTRFGKLLERVVRGEGLIITKHDKPVARLVPEWQPDLDTVRLPEDESACRKARTFGL